MQARLLEKCFAAGLVVLCIGRALSSGKDANWDLQNYHHYAPWALINGGYARDVLAGNWQSYLNPSIYLVRYATLWAAPWVTAAILAGIQSIGLILIYVLARELFRGEQPSVRFRLAAVSTLLAVTSPLFVSELGTSFADSLLAIPMLAALLLLNVGGDGRRTWVLLAASGALMGMAIGLKLTNALFLPGYVLAALIGRSSRSALARAVLATGFGGGAGVLVSAGPWAFLMWREFGNPLFPLANFINPREGMIVSAYDGNFLPVGLLDALSMPLKWAIGVQSTAEMSFTDVRPFLLCIILVAIVILHPILRKRLPASDGAASHNRLVAFLLLGAVTWISASAIHRYAIILELLIGPAIVVGLRRIGGTYRSQIAGACLLILAVATIDIPNWRHVRPFDRSHFAVSLPEALHAPATYILAPARGLPLGFLASEFPPDASFIQSSVSEFFLPESTLVRRARRIIANTSPHRLFVLIDIRPDEFREFAVAGLSWRSGSPCLAITTAFRPIWACPLQAEGAGAPRSP